jgi:hypothetical protein
LPSPIGDAMHVAAPSAHPTQIYTHLSV